MTNLKSTDQDFYLSLKNVLATKFIDHVNEVSSRVVDLEKRLALEKDDNWEGNRKMKRRIEKLELKIEELNSAVESRLAVSVPPGLIAAICIIEFLIVAVLVLKFA